MQCHGFQCKDRGFIWDVLQFPDLLSIDVENFRTLLQSNCVNCGCVYRYACGDKCTNLPVGFCFVFREIWEKHGHPPNKSPQPDMLTDI